MSPFQKFEDLEHFIGEHDTLRYKLKEIFRRWVPFTMANFVSLVIEVISMAFVGRLNDPEALAIIGLSNMMINIFAFSLMFGMNTALETLASQAAGAKNYKKAGVYFYRGRFILVVMFIPIFIFLAFSDKLL